MQDTWLPKHKCVDRFRTSCFDCVGFGSHALTQHFEQASTVK